MLSDLVIIVPLFFPGLTIQANMYYKMLIGWTSQRIKDSYSIHNTFDFKHGNLHDWKSISSLFLLDKSLCMKSNRTVIPFTDFSDLSSLAVVITLQSALLTDL